MNQSLALLADSEWPSYFARPDILIFAIPIIAILVGGIVGLTKTLIRHRERMAMIERGMHPDHPQAPNDPLDQS